MPALPVQIANAARCAVEAVDLAQNGMLAAHQAIEGTFGYLRLFETETDLAPVLAAFGTVYRIAELSWKPFPTGRAAHGAIVATQELMRKHGLSAENCKRLVYRAPPLIFRLVGRPMVPGMQPAYARLCFPYLGAVVLRKGTIGLGDFTRKSFDDPAIANLAQKITVDADDNPDPAAFVPATATAHFTDGRARSVQVAAQFGSPAWPLSEAEHRAKAQSCLDFGGMNHIDGALAHAIAGFEFAPDGADVFRFAMRGTA
jgi:2-methylcitrate dehydratase PrpD